MADTEKELLGFGRMIGCKPEWLQHSRTGVPHFDITVRMRARAVSTGAIEIGPKEVVELMRRDWNMRYESLQETPSLEI